MSSELAIKDEALELFNRGIEEIGSRLNSLVKDSLKITAIKTADDSAAANELLRTLRAALKSVDEHRKEWGKPFRDMLDYINEQVSIRLADAKLEEDRLTGLIQKWHRDQQAKYEAELETKRREEERRRKIQEAHEAAGHKVKETITPVAEPVPVKLRDSTKTRIQRDFEIVDFFAIPAQYLKPNWQLLALDTVLIRRAITRGEDVPGIQVVERQVVVT